MSTGEMTDVSMAGDENKDSNLDLSFLNDSDNALDSEEENTIEQMETRVRLVAVLVKTDRCYKGHAQDKNNRGAILSDVMKGATIYNMSVQEEPVEGEGALNYFDFMIEKDDWKEKLQKPNVWPAGRQQMYVLPEKRGLEGMSEVSCTRMGRHTRAR